MGGRRRVGERAVGYARPSGEAEGRGKSLPLRLGRDGEGTHSTEVFDLTLPRKASSKA